MVWAAASRKPRILSHVGLDTFVDPGQGGGRLNDVTTLPMVERVRVDEGDWLSFTVVPIDVVIIRGTTADEFGNIDMEHEPRSSAADPGPSCPSQRGLVIAEVKRMARRGSLSPQLVRVPGILVDAVVVSPEAWQIHGVERYNPAVSGELRAPRGQAPPVTLDERMLVARRAAMALRPGAVLNIGFGISDGLPSWPPRRGCSTTSRSRSSKGRSAASMRGRALAAQSNVEAIVDQISQFNFYQGGGLDLAFLSFAEAMWPETSNVNKFGLAPPGTWRVHRHLPEREGCRLLWPVREGGGHARGEWAPPRRRPRPGDEVPEAGGEHATFSGHARPPPGSPSATSPSEPLRPRVVGSGQAARARSGMRPRAGRARRDGVPGP